MLGCDRVWTCSLSNVANICSEFLLSICTELVTSCNKYRKPSLLYRSDIQYCVLPRQALFPSFAQENLFLASRYLYLFGVYACGHVLHKAFLYYGRDCGYLPCPGYYPCCCRINRSMNTVFSTSSRKNDELRLVTNDRGARSTNRNHSINNITLLPK